MRFSRVWRVAGFLLALGVSGASAQTATYTLGVGNTSTGGMSGYPAPYATVTVNLTSSTTASLTFAAATAGNYQYLFLDSSIVDANVNAASWTAGSFAGSTLNSNFSPFTCANTGCNGGSATVDGFGVFNQTVNSFDGYNYAQSTVSFILTDTSGTWANAASVLTPNSNGYLAAAHMAVCDTSLGACSPSIAAIATGYATTSAVPEPTSFMLAAAGLGGLGFLRRRRRKSA